MVGRVCYSVSCAVSVLGQICPGRTDLPRVNCMGFIAARMVKAQETTGGLPKGGGEA